MTVSELTLLAGRVARREVAARKLVEAAMRRIEGLDAEFHTVVASAGETRHRRRLARSMTRAAHGVSGPLTGLPVAGRLAAWGVRLEKPLKTSWAFGEIGEPCLIIRRSARTWSGSPSSGPGKADNERFPLGGARRSSLGRQADEAHPPVILERRPRCRTAAAASRGDSSDNSRRARLGAQVVHAA